jgi:tetratricopeptide (TPR) repeat protein
MQIDFSIRNTPDDLFGQAVEMVEKAVALDPYSPQSQWAYGFVFMVGRQFEEAAQAVEKAVRLSPNYADGWGLLSLINNNLGHADQALRFIRKAMALNPAYSWDYPYNEGRALYTLREYEQSLPPLLEALERNENSLLPRLFLAASYVRLGLMEEANWEISEIEISHPGITLSRFDERIPMAEGEHKTRLFADLEQAGVPE